MSDGPFGSLGPVILPPWLYRMAKKEGYDLNGYVMQQPIPTSYETPPEYPGNKGGGGGTDG